uniref:Uncharacterized protein n=1 Tax=Panagrolaimus sp. JU765 TaxID=591449 RepID=A0AC34QB52_9BILA
MAEDGGIDLTETGELSLEVNQNNEANNLEKADDGVLSDNEVESNQIESIESPNDKEIEQSPSINPNSIEGDEFQNKEIAQLKEPVVNEPEVQETNLDSEGEVVSNSSGSSSPIYNEIQSDIDEHLTDLFSLVYSQRYSMENLLHVYRELIELICFNINADNVEEEANFLSGSEIISQQLEDFHPQANILFEKLSSVLNDLIVKIEAETEAGNAENIEWASNLRIFAQNVREAFYCIPSTFQPNFPMFPPLYAAVDTEMGFPPRSTNYRYLANLPWPVMPSSFYVPPIMKTEKVITGLPMLNAVYRTESNVGSDVSYLPPRNLTSEVTSSSSPGQDFVANPSASMLSMASTTVSESDQNLSTNLPTLSNVTAGHSTNASNIFGPTNPFGPNRVDNPPSTFVPSTVFPRPQQPLPFAATNVQNFVRPIAAPSAVTSSTQRIPSLLDIQVAPPTSIFKRPSETNPPPTKRVKTASENTPEIEEDAERSPS